MKIKVKYPLETTFLDYPDNESMAVLVFMMGCDRECPLCHNIQFKNPNYDFHTKQVTTSQLLDYIKKTCQRNLTNKLVLSGGDPLSSFNLDFTSSLLPKCESAKINVAVYTAYDIEYVKQKQITGFTFIKCGEYKQELSVTPVKTTEYMMLASTNQNFYNSNYKPLGNNGKLIFH